MQVSETGIPESYGDSLSPPAWMADEPKAIFPVERGGGTVSGEHAEYLKLPSPLPEPILLCYAQMVYFNPFYDLQSGRSSAQMLPIG